MSIATLARLALAGTRTDALRVGLTAVSALLAVVTLLATATVATLGFADSHGGSATWAEQYSSHLLREPGLRPGVFFALGALTIPILALAAQCSRIGAPARERRLAGLRLAGATPAQAVWVAAAETTVAAAIGDVAGLGAFLALRAGLDHPGPDGLLDFPTDVAVSPVWYVVICLGLPILAGAIAALSLRRVTLGPLGVARSARPARPGWWPGLLIVLGVATFAAFRAWADHLPEWLLPIQLALGALLAAIGTVLGVGFIARVTGALLARSATPSVLIAGRRLVADPWSGSRAMGAMLAAIVVGAGALMLRSYFQTQAALGVEFGQSEDPFFLDTMNLVDIAVLIAGGIAGLALMVAFTERIVARRRAYAALTATGTPRSTVAWAQVWQVIAPAIPAIGLALVVGTALIQAFGTTASLDGSGWSYCPGDPTQAACAVDPSRFAVAENLSVTRVAPIPFASLAMLGGGALALLLVVTALSLTVLRSSTDIAELRAT